MGAAALPVIVISVFWAIVAFVIPLFAHCTNRKHKEIITAVSLMTGLSCWLFWSLCYLHQMNPLIGPDLHNTTIIAIMDIWDGTFNHEMAAEVMS